MRLQACRIVLKYIDILLREEREKVNRFRNFLSDVVRQSDMVLLSLCTVSTLYGMVLIASATHFRGTLKYVAIQGFGLLLGVLLYFLLSSIDVSEVSKKWKWLLAFNFGFILLLRTPFGLTRNGNRAWLGVNDIGAQLGIGFLKNFPITVQPAEIVKITFILLLARQLALLQEKKDLTRFSNVIQPTAHAGIMFLFYYVISKDAGSGLVRAEGGDAHLCQCVHHAQCKGVVLRHHNVIKLFFHCKAHHGIHIGGLDVLALGVIADAAVARCAPDLAAVGALFQHNRFFLLLDFLTVCG